MKSKVDMQWEVSREQEEIFREHLPKIVNGVDVDELFRLIRGSEYRRGKQDTKKEFEKVIDKFAENNRKIMNVFWLSNELKKQIYSSEELNKTEVKNEKIN